EDGIRDYKVTGVQTCALPIFADAGELDGDHHFLVRVVNIDGRSDGLPAIAGPHWEPIEEAVEHTVHLAAENHERIEVVLASCGEIGRASCRERDERAGRPV